MSVISIKLNDEEEKILKKYTESKGMTIINPYKLIIFNILEVNFKSRAFYEIKEDFLSK